LVIERYLVLTPTGFSDSGRRLLTREVKDDDDDVLPTTLFQQKQMAK
jgi:hypothetical protein